MKQYTLVYFNDKLDETGYPFKHKQVYVYFGEIPNMLGHCIVMNYDTGQMFAGYHIENFKEIPEDDV